MLGAPQGRILPPLPAGLRPAPTPPAQPEAAALLPLLTLHRLAIWRREPSLQAARPTSEPPCSVGATARPACSPHSAVQPQTEAGPGTELGGRVMGSHATSGQRRVRPNSQRPRPGRQGGRPRAKHLLRAVHKLWAPPEEDPPGREPSPEPRPGPRRDRPAGTASQDPGDPESTPRGSVRPLLDRNVSSRDGEGPVFFPPHRVPVSGSRQDRQPRVRVRARTVPSTRGRAAPSLPGHLPERCPGRGHGRSGGGRALRCPLRRVAPGAARSRRAESRLSNVGRPLRPGPAPAPARASERPRRTGRDGPGALTPAGAGPASASSMYKRGAQHRPPGRLTGRRQGSAPSPSPRPWGTKVSRHFPVRVQDWTRGPDSP